MPPITRSKAAVEAFSWNTAAPSPIGRFEAQGTAANGKLYVFGGFINSSIQATKKSHVYNPVKNKWTRIADMPEPVTHAPVVVDGQTIYLLGGYVGTHPGPSTNHVWKYNIATNKWSAAPPLPAPRGGGAAAVLGRKIHFFSGATRKPGQHKVIDKGNHYVLSLDGGKKWSSRAPLPNPRNHLGGVALGGRVYALGGQQGGNETIGNQSQVHFYNSSTNTWKRVKDLPVPRGHINASTFVMNNRIYVIGGTLNGNQPSGAVTMYNPQTNVWVNLHSLPAKRKSPVADVVGNQIVVSTGNSGGATPTTTTWTSVQ